MAPPRMMRAGFSQGGWGLATMQTAALPKQTAPSSGPCALFFTSPVTAAKTRATPTELHAMATALAADLGSSACSLSECAAKPRAVMMARPGSRNISPEASPPLTPRCVMPMAKATCVLEGPGRQFAMATSSMNRALESHLCSSTKRFWNIPRCTGGPPKAVLPSTKKCRAMATTDGASGAPASSNASLAAMAAAGHHASPARSRRREPPLLLCTAQRCDT
mmetsp:Transcript_47444/g.144047  ORF Transcript_47444/g.144047 Transcript_47444/m.144047 type:complete len:221 (+) Transcript_47444:762-1424(+)